jgi:hypothetical protein
MREEVRALDHPPQRQKAAECQHPDEDASCELRAPVAKKEKQREQRKAGGRVTGGPTPASGFSLRLVVQNMHVGVGATKFLDIPWTVNAGEVLEVGDNAGGQPHRHYQVAERPSPLLPLTTAEADHPAKQRQQRKSDHRLFQEVVHEVFEHPCVLADEAIAGGIEPAFDGKIHGSGVDQYQCH